MINTYKVTIHTPSGRIEQRIIRAKNKHGAEHAAAKSLGIKTPGSATAVLMK